MIDCFDAGFTRDPTEVKTIQNLFCFLPVNNNLILTMIGYKNRTIRAENDFVPVRIVKNRLHRYGAVFQLR